MKNATFLQRLGYALAFATIFLTRASVQSSVLEHERLRTVNPFKTPMEVVSYYTSRDASGFIWSGMLDSERRAFTTWKEAPMQDTFYIAKDYAIAPTSVKESETKVVIDVKYDLLAIGDGFGTQLPTDEKTRIVHFELVKVNNQWKISKPDARDISPVVLDTKFNAWTAQNN